MDLTNKNKIYFQIFCYLSIIAGIILRFAQYLSNKSLWRDEARIALNLIEKNFIELAGPLNYDQSVHPGFMLLEKLFVSVLGTSEYSLRLFPLLCGVLSVLIFYKIVKKTLSVYSRSIALVLFSALTPLIYYSSELKQYSSDVLASEILLLWAINLTETKFTLFRGIITGLLGAVLLWISYPSVFILAGIGLFLFVNFLKDQKRNLLLLLFIYIVWSLSFYLLYKVSLHTITESPFFNKFWDADYMPLSITTMSSITWLLIAWSKFLAYLTLDAKTAFVIILGIFCLFFKNKKVFIILDRKSVV